MLLKDLSSIVLQVQSPTYTYLCTRIGAFIAHLLKEAMKKNEMKLN